jgi:hypothetical protein
MKKLTKCNNVMITSLIIIGTFILFFYLYVYGYRNEGFINISGKRTPWDKKSDIETQIATQNAASYPALNPPANGTFSDCGLLTEYGQSACINGVTKEHIKCKWNSSPTSYSGQSVQMSTGGKCYIP